MGMYTTQLKTICESVVLQLNLERKETGGVRPVTIDDLMNDPAYKYSYEQLNHEYTPYFICDLNGVQSRIFGGFRDVPDETHPKDTLYPLFDNEYRKPLQYKILLHYYTREICEETFGLWKLRLISKLNDIMPYYNQLYTETFEKYLGTDYNLFDNINMSVNENFDKKLERLVDSILNEKMNNQNKSTGNSTEEHSGTDTHNYNRNYTVSPSGAGYVDKIVNPKVTKTSDTPQGSVTNLTNGYLTRVVEETGDIVTREYDQTKSVSSLTKDNQGSYESDTYGHGIETNNTSHDSSTRKTNTTNNENEQAKEHHKNMRVTKGKSNFQTYASILKEIRENLINVDKMVIDELEPLFFGLW